MSVSNSNSLTQGSLWKAIWTMSWPLTLTTVAGSITSMVDIQVAGLLGSSAQAAVGLCEQLLFVFMVFILSISVGTTAVVSRAWGAEDYQGTIAGTAQSLSMAFLVGFCLSIISYFVAQTVLPLLSTGQAMLTQGKLYLSIFGLFLIPFSIVSTVNAAFRAVGDARTPLVIVLVSTSICVIGDYITVLLQWPVPGVGIRGIAFSALVGNSVAALLAVWLLRRSSLKQSFWRLWPFVPQVLKRIISIGMPSALHRLSWSMAAFLVFFILTRCPSPIQAIAAWTIGVRLESIVFMPLMALSMAIASIVGQNLGARQVKRAFIASWNITWIGIALMSVLGSFLFLCAQPLAQLMTHDPQAISYTVSYLRINAISEPFLALALVLSGAMQGAGDSRTPMWISIFCNWLVRLPIAWLVGVKLGYGPVGVWLAMTISIIVFGLMAVWRFQSRSWIKVRV